MCPYPEPELAPLRGGWGRVGEWWQAELPLLLQHCFSVQMVEKVKQEDSPTLSPVLGIVGHFL